VFVFFFFSSRRRHTRFSRDWSSDVCSSDLYFTQQGGVGYAFLRKAEHSGLARETWLTLFVPLLLAGIGLIAQIYNLHGDGWQALLLWVTITLPAVWLTQSWALAHLWPAAVLLASVIWA